MTFWGASMPVSESDELFRAIARDFEVLAAQLERAIELFAHDDSGALNVAALHRARGAAWRGAELTKRTIEGSSSIDAGAVSTDPFGRASGQLSEARLPSIS